MALDSNIAPVRNAKDLPAPEQERLFTHGLHEEGVFYNRLNFFLVFESLLFAALVSGYSGKDAPPIAISVPICVLGIVASLLWWYVQVNKIVLLNILEERVREAFDEFRESLVLANQRRVFKMWSANAVLAYWLPPMFLVAWLYYLGYILLNQSLSASARALLV